MKRKNDIVIRDRDGKVIRVAPNRDTAFRIFPGLPDGIYSVEGKRTNLVVEKINGIAYPTAGTLDGKKMPPRTSDDAREFFRGGQS